MSPYEQRREMTTMKRRRWGKVVEIKIMTEYVISPIPRVSGVFRSRLLRLLRFSVR
jgi:hypothetical protein